MKKQNQLIAYATCVLLLSSIINCQENRRPIVERRTKAMTDKQELSQEAIEEGTEVTAAKPLIDDNIKQTKKITPPTTWQMISYLLPQIFVQSFSTGYTTGIAAFTKMIIKEFIKKRQLPAIKEAFELEKANLFSIKDGKKSFTEQTEQSLLEKTFKQFQKINLTDTSNKEKIFDNLFTKNASTLLNAFTEKESAIKQLEQQTSASFIFQEAASTALIYTLASMTGEILKVGIGIALQLMIPTKD